MSIFEKTENAGVDREVVRANLEAAIQLILDEIRPTSTQAKVLEQIVNSPPNGAPAHTYDLDVCNKNLPGNIEAPNIWCAIGYDMAPFQSDWDRLKWADENQKSIRNAVYGLGEQFATLDVEGAERFALYIFAPNPPSREIGVVTFDPDYRNALDYSSKRITGRLRSAVSSTARRFTVMGKDRPRIAYEMVEALNQASEQAGLENHIEIKAIEGGSDGGK